MGFVRRWPIKFTLPLFLFGLVIVMSIVTMLIDFKKSTRQLEENTVTDIIQEMNLVQGVLDNLLRKGDTEGVQSIFSDLGAKPDINLSILFDETNRILFSNDMRFVGQSAKEIAPKLDWLLVSKILKNTKGIVSLSASRDEVVGYYPINISQLKKVSSHTIGIFYLDHDLSRLKSVMKNEIIWRMLINSFYYALIFFLLAVFLHFSITKGAAELAIASQKIASGDFSAQVDIKGRNEISQIATAFNHMVVQVNMRNKALAASEKLFRDALEYLPISIGIVVNNDITQLNQKFIETFGYSLEDMPTIDIWMSKAYPDPEYRREVLSSWENDVLYGVEHDAVTPPREYNITCKDGSKKIAIIRARKIGSQLLTSFVDITDRKSAELALKISEQRLRTIIETEPECVKIVGAKGELLEMNRAGLDMLEASTFDEVKRETLIKFIHPEFRAAFRELHYRVMKGESGILEFKVSGLRGTERWLETHATPLRNENGEITTLLGITRDITERKQAEIDMNNALEVAKLAALTKSRFLDIAAHELRTPVTSFSLIIQLAQKQLAKGHPVESSTLERLRSQAERISRLVVDLLDVSRLERNAVKLQLEVIDIVSLIAEHLEDFKILNPNRNILFINPGKPIKLEIDSVRISQVITNIITNAIKYTPNDTPIEISIETKPSAVRVSIKDYGPGISDELQAVLFTPLARGSIELTGRSGGLGLGLYISRVIIELHGGTIGAVSKIGIGSTFYFELPTSRE